MKSYKAYLIDLDGTLYNGTQAIDTAVYFVKHLLKEQIPFKFVTNNATRTPAQLCEWIYRSFGLKISINHIYTSTMALVDYIQKENQGCSVYVIGEAALKSQIEASGFLLTDNDTAQLVIQGLDRQVTYHDLSIGVRSILNGASFLVTNEDRLIPFENGFNPSSGAITSFIQFATAQKPIVFGKPNAPIIEGALKSLNLMANDVLMIGDNYETDILAGINNGVDTLLVLTGVTKAEQIDSLNPKPTFVVENLADWTYL